MREELKSLQMGTKSKEESSELSPFEKEFLVLKELLEKEKGKTSKEGASVAVGSQQSTAPAPQLNPQMGPQFSQNPQLNY